MLQKSSPEESDHAIRMTASTLLIDLFFDEGTVLQNMPLMNNMDIRTVFYENLKQGLQHPDKVYKFTLWGASFALLDHYLDNKSAESP